MLIPVLIYVVIVAALVWAEYRSARTAQVWFKTLAALGFCLLAVLSGALYTGYGQIILMGLIACAFGDVLLLPRDKPLLFKLGMLAFALGHIFYTYAFFKEGYEIWVLIVIGVGMLITCSRIMAYLKPHLPDDMKLPVLIYMVIISAMMIFAYGTHTLFIMIPALLFAVSDMFVARDRFVVTEPRNALIITPLYFCAQALFALGVFTLL